MFHAKFADLSTTYKMPFAICRSDVWFLIYERGPKRSPFAPNRTFQSPPGIGLMPRSSMRHETSVSLRGAVNDSRRPYFRRLLCSLSVVCWLLPVSDVIWRLWTFHDAVLDVALFRCCEFGYFVWPRAIRVRAIRARAIGVRLITAGATLRKRPRLKLTGN